MAVFEINTGETCLFCLTNCSTEGHSVPPKTRSFIQRRPTCFKMLLRYLKIDILSLSPLSSSFGSLLDESESSNANVEVLLCRNCSVVTTEFVHWFKIFEEARLRLDEICGELLNQIREGEGDLGRLKEYRKSLKSVSQLSGKPLEALLNASLAESLRNVTKQKCSERLSKSIPKVSLTRGDSVKRRKIDSLAISEEAETTTEKEKISEPIIVNENLVEDPNPQLSTDKPFSRQCTERLSKTLAKVSLIREKGPRNGKKIACFTNSRESVIKSENIIELSDDQRNLGEESSLQLDNTNSSEDVEIVYERNNVSFETDIGGGTVVSQLEIDDKSPPGSPLQEQVNPPSPPRLDVRLSLENNKPPQPVVRSSSKLVKCLHCENTFKKLASLRVHMILVHPFLKYPTAFPPNTTIAQLKSIVNLLAFGGKIKPMKIDGKFACTICSMKIPWKKRLRLHVFDHHFGKIIDLLRLEEACSTSETIVDNVPGNKNTSQEQQDHPMETAGENVLSNNLQSEENAISAPNELVEAPPLNSDALKESTPTPSSNIQTKPPPPPPTPSLPPALDPIPTSAATALLALSSLTPATPKFPSRMYINNSVLPPAEEALEDPRNSDPPSRANSVPSSSLQRKEPPPTLALNTTMPSTPAEALVPIPSTPVAPKFPCLNCGKIFISNDSLTKHKMANHTIFRCGQCQQNFESSSILATHLFSAHTLNFCAARLPPLTSEEDLEQAISSFAQSRKIFSGGKLVDALGCRICSEECFMNSQRYQLRTHILETHFDLVTSKLLQSKPWTGGTTGSSIQATKVQKAQSAARELDRCGCHLCSEDFITRHSSISQDHFLSSGKVMCLCNYCGQGLSGRANFRLHLVDIHPIIVFSGRLPPGTSESEFNKAVETLEGRARETLDKGGIVHFQCPCCPKRYANKGHLRPHILHVHMSDVVAGLEKGVADHGIQTDEAHSPGAIRIGMVYQA